MSASPEFYKPAAPPAAYSPRILLAVTEPAAEDSCYYACSTPTGAGISFGGDAATCPPAPRKPRPPPASACRKRLFAAGDVVTLRFDDLEAIFRPAPSPRFDGLTTRASRNRGAILS
ncbi:cyclin-dependent protein kinase inhibitor EL2 [Lolium perenne]|jgi:hypothetical protein|uniref:cyclin-dependent protein kinase inhibitor EL2 n=1 Tax=Lolium perenne TaxID=4522 RepID=UPI0021EA67FA|nr:cyclin-dependent protein kinase inhibitor EL2-like [Lolium perenne]